MILLLLLLLLLFLLLTTITADMSLMCRQSFVLNIVLTMKVMPELNELVMVDGVSPSPVTASPVRKALPMFSRYR